MNRFMFRIRRLFASDTAYIELLKRQGVRIGKGCKIEKNVNFGSEPWLISIGDNVRITNNVQLITHDGSLWVLRNMGLVNSKAVKYGSIHIGSNCNIGWNAIIMPGVSIGNNVVIAAGAVVTKNIPENEVWGGVPAKFIETIGDYYTKINDDIVDTMGMSSEQIRLFLKNNRPDLLK